MADHLADLHPLLLRGLRTGVVPSSAEIAEATGKTVAEVERILAAPDDDETDDADAESEDPDAQRFRDRYHRLVAERCAEWAADHGDLAATEAYFGALLELPLHRLAIGVFFLAIVVDNPKEHPAEDLWDSPLKPIGVFLYENLNNITGISALRFSMTDVLLTALAQAISTRQAAWVQQANDLEQQANNILLQMRLRRSLEAAGR